MEYTDNSQSPVEYFCYLQHDRKLRARNRLGESGLSLLGIPMAGFILVMYLLDAVERELLWRDHWLFHTFVILFLTFFMIWTWLYAVGTLVTTSDFILEHEGIKILVLESWNVFIPWDRISDIKMIGIRRYSKADRPSKKVKAYVFCSRELPFLFKFVGLFFFIGFKPIFVVTEDHDRYRTLVKRLTDL